MQKKKKQHTLKKFCKFSVKTQHRLNQLQYLHSQIYFCVLRNGSSDFLCSSQTTNAIILPTKYQQFIFTFCTQAISDVCMTSLMDAELVFINGSLDLSNHLILQLFLNNGIK